jgi:hypothetical protein
MTHILAFKQWVFHLLLILFFLVKCTFVFWIGIKYKPILVMASLEMLKKLNCYFFSKFVIIVHYHNTFLGFVVIKLLLKMSNLRKLQGKEKYKIW